MRLARSLPFVVLTLGLSVTSARASSIVYDNGAIKGTIGRLPPGVSSFVVTDSFSVGSATTLDSATVGLWVMSGDTPTSVTWSIGTAAFGADVASGTSLVLKHVPFTSGVPEPSTSTRRCSR